MLLRRPTPLLLCPQKWCPASLEGPGLPPCSPDCGLPHPANPSPPQACPLTPGPKHPPPPAPAGAAQAGGSQAHWPSLLWPLQTGSCILLQGSLPVSADLPTGRRLPSVWRPSLFHSSVPGRRFCLDPFVSVSLVCVCCPVVWRFSRLFGGQRSSASIQ